MHPDLLNNSCFLKYYKQWQDDPGSIVFVPIAEHFLNHGLIDDAFNICNAGLKKHPSLASGLAMMAKIQIKRGNWEEAEDLLISVLASLPGNKLAIRLKAEVNNLLKADLNEAKGFAVPEVKREALPDEEFLTPDPSWNTVTMANIYKEQGHFDRARAIYKTILEKDPDNLIAKKGLESIEETGNMRDENAGNR